ncbi:DUF935 family protein [Belliella sp. DSM 107340]|uniref:DUF935 family protein n=1 Tax=Belliella calami TaxID=2923436 RepID=A0ABS9UU13_9BACT|nr:DUF935 family protein [Belliella calami]MCH7400115.1 DUF935 family protein [Belliella calami]
MMDNKETNAKVGKRYLPWQPKSISRVRQDIKSWNMALNMFNLELDPVTWRLQLLYREIRLDALASSQLSNRQNQVFSSDFELIKPNGDVDEEQTKALKSHPLYRFFTQVVQDSEWDGYSLVELSKKASGELVGELIPRYNVVPQTGKFYPDYTDLSKFTKYREMPEFGTWILEFNSRHEGLLNKIVAPVLLSRFAESCWSELCEIYGIPPRVMKTDTQNATALKRAEKMMRDMGSASWFIIDETEEFEFAKGVSTNGDVYKNLISHLRDKICLLISGGLIGQDTDNGSRSKDQVSFEMLWLLVQSDMARLEEAWNNTIIPALVKHGVLKGDLRFKFSESEDTAELWKFVQGLLPHYNIDPEWIKEKFGIEITGERQRQSFEETLSLALSQRGESGFFPQALPKDFGRADCGCLHTSKLSLPKDAPKTDSLIDQVAESKGNLKFSADTFEATANTLIKGFNKGLDGSKIKLSRSIPDRFSKPSTSKTLAIDIKYGIDSPHLLTSFELNMFRFSAGKTLAEVQALNQVFRDAPNFDIFKTNAKQIGDVWNDQWLKTEYDTAILVGESSSNYYSLMEDIEVFPYWRYVTIGDGAVRPEHAELDGLILPANDPLWQRIYPPNGWNCRCYVVAMTRDEIQGVDFAAQRQRVNQYFGSDTFDKAAQQGFGVNRALTGEVFTANQQYITGKNLTATNKQLNNLDASDYKMKPYDQAKTIAKSNKPVYEGTAQEYFDKLDTLNGKQTVYDYNKRALNVDPVNFQKHTTGSKESRVKLISAMEETLAKPDELWLHGKRNTSKLDDLVYLKYYQDKTMVVVGRQSANNIIELMTWFELTEKTKVIESYRRGISLKK